METCSVVLTLKSFDEILWCDHSNETSTAVFLHGTIFFFFSTFYNINLGFFLNFDIWHFWELKGSTSTSTFIKLIKSRYISHQL